MIRVVVVFQDVELMINMYSRELFVSSATVDLDLFYITKIDRDAYFPKERITYFQLL